MDLLSGYHYEFVTTEPLPFKPKHIFECRSPELIKRLKEGKFDAIFCAGYALWLDWQVIYFALRNGIPLICRPELNDLGVKRGWLKKTVRDIFLRWYFSKISAFLYIGRQAKNGFLTYGGITSKTFFSPYSVDNSFFSPRHVRSRVDLKKEFGEKYCWLCFSFENDYKKKSLRVAFIPCLNIVCCVFGHR